MGNNLEFRKPTGWCSPEAIKFHRLHIGMVKLQGPFIPMGRGWKTSEESMCGARMMCGFWWDTSPESVRNDMEWPCHYFFQNDKNEKNTGGVFIGYYPTSCILNSVSLLIGYTILYRPAIWGFGGTPFLDQLKCGKAVSKSCARRTTGNVECRKITWFKRKSSFLHRMRPLLIRSVGFKHL